MVREAALAAHAAGLCVVPPREDGSKRPVGPWKRYMRARPGPAELDRWYGPRLGIGLVCGRVSGGLELLEFEGRAVAAGLLESFIDAAIAAGFSPLVERIRAGYEEWTPSGGIHWLLHVFTPRANTVLAARPATPEEIAAKPRDRVKVLIETRGEGGYTHRRALGGCHPPVRATLGARVGRLRHHRDDQRRGARGTPRAGASVRRDAAGRVSCTDHEPRSHGRSAR